MPPPTQVAAPVVVHHGGEGGGQSWKSHALQWHVANPTFAAEGTIELYRDVVEDYRRVVCGTPAARERQRELERVMDMMKNPQRYSESQSTHSTPHTQQQQQQQQSEEEDTLEDETEDDMDDTADEDEYEQEMIEKGDHEFLTEIEAKGGLRRRDSGHGQSSSEEMDIDEDMDEEERHPHRRVVNNGSVEPVRTRAVKRESEPMPMDFQLEDSSYSSNGRSHYRNGLRPRKMERSCSANEQERLIMDMALDKPYHRHHHHGQLPLSSVHPLESLDVFRRSSTCSLSSSSASSSSSSSPALSPSSTSSAVSGLGLSRSGSPAPFTPLSPSSRRSGRDSNRPKSARATLRRSYSSPSTTTARLYSRPPTSHGRSSLDHSLPNATSSQQHVQQHQQQAVTSPSSSFSPLSRSSSSSTITHSQPQQPPQKQQQELQQQRPLRTEDLDFDLASACANTFASDLAFVLARVPGLGAHFHRFEQLSKLKLHVGWAKHAQSRGGNDVFVMSCSRLISLLAPLANTPLVSERGG